MRGLSGGFSVHLHLPWKLSAIFNFCLVELLGIPHCGVLRKPGPRSGSGIHWERTQSDRVEIALSGAQSVFVLVLPVIVANILDAAPLNLRFTFSVIFQYSQQYSRVDITEA